MNDFSFMENEGKAPPLLPEGTYIVRMKKYRPGRAKNEKATPRVTATFDVIEPVEIADPDTYAEAQKFFTQDMWLGSPGAESMTSQALDAFGIEYEGEGDNWKARFSRATGAVARAVVAHERYQDNPPRVTVKRFLPIE